MRDPYWFDAWMAVQPLLTQSDKLLLPPGEWPPGPCATRTYIDQVELRDATVLLLHKGKMAGMRKAQLRWVMARWDCVFANEVFVCFSKSAVEPSLARPVAWRHVTKLTEYLRPRAAKRIRQTVFYVHIPKAGGTCVWNQISPGVPSSVYYDNAESFRHNPPLPGEYDLVGGHVPLAVMAPHIGPDDRIVGLIREPTSRFRSAFLHSRRPGEDAATFTASMSAMRSCPLRAYLATAEAQVELRLQLLMLGSDFPSPFASQSNGQMLRNAMQWLDDPRAVFYPMEQLDVFVGVLSSLLRLEAAPSALSSVNASDLAEAADSLDEFEIERAVIAARNRIERRLYDRVGEAARSLLPPKAFAAPAV